MSLPEYTCPTHTNTCTNISLHLTHMNIAHHVITCTCTPMEVQVSLQCANIETFCLPQEQGSWASWRSVSDLRRSLHAGVYCGTGPLQWINPKARKLRGFQSWFGFPSANEDSRASVQIWAFTCCRALPDPWMLSKLALLCNKTYWEDFCLPWYLLLHLFVHPLTHPFIHSFVHSFYHAAALSQVLSWIPGMLRDLMKQGHWGTYRSVVTDPKIRGINSFACF